METLWQKDGTTLHPAIEAYTVGNDRSLDTVLMPHDIEASKAHAIGLCRIGVITGEELKGLLSTLDQLKVEFVRGNIAITPADEDCHSVLEKHLTDRLGDTGKKIHTGRSRNDQVLVALRLFMREALTKVKDGSIDLASQFLGSAYKYQHVPLPGYSHTQQAMLSSVGHYYASILESLLDDISVLSMVSEQLNANPLGSAAGFGVSFPLDRQFTTGALNFSRLQTNSLYCQNSRGKFESLFLEALEQVMMTLGKFAQDMLLFTSQEFSFFDVDPALVTGSSIMPQKKNLDGLEILRGNVSVVVANHSMIHGLAKGLMTGYNRDFQLMKKPLIESADIAHKSIGVAGLYLNGFRPREDRIRVAISSEIFKADIANALVAEQGIPFREAYLLVKEDTASSAPDVDRNIRSKISPGAPGNLCLDVYAQRLESLRKELRT